jgi:TRAP-type C4-dicarboxylate transport system permease small subunit
MRKLEQWNETLGRVEKFLIVVMLSMMILVAFLQIVLRNAFSTGISWGDPLVRYLVLWVGFIGASLAT